MRYKYRHDQLRLRVGDFVASIPDMTCHQVIAKEQVIDGVDYYLDTGFKVRKAPFDKIAFYNNWPFFCIAQMWEKVTK